MVEDDRKLAAVLAADIVGFSRLMAEDEAGTLSLLKRFRTDIVDPKVASYRGRVVGSAGDSVLAEFPSALGAVQCAIDIQSSIGAESAALPEAKRMYYRIGINLGDVISDGQTIYGDGVNIAARLEKLAEPGGVVVSRSVRDQARGKMALGFADMGEIAIHNIPEPVHAWRLQLHAPEPSVPAQPDAKGSNISIAVLPFANMSGDREQEYFSDGITEDIITDLSKIPSLSVLARNTAFTFKGNAVDVSRIAQQLNVSHVLEGSVRKAGGRVRITAQLIDGKNGRHIWAERYDRDLADIFAVQDEISQNIVGALQIHFSPGDAPQLEVPSKDRVRAYDIFLLGRHFLRQSQARQTLKTARRLFAKAIEADPRYGRAYAGMAICDSQLLLVNDPSASIETIMQNSNRALELEPGLAEAHASRGEVLSISDKPREAAEEFDLALSLDPNSFEANYFYARHCRVYGDLEKSVALLERAAELDANDYRSLSHLAALYRSLKHPEKAVIAIKRSLQRINVEIQRHPENTDARTLGATLFVTAGENERGLAWADRAELLIEDNPTDWYNLACVYINADDVDKGLSCLERVATGIPVSFAKLMEGDVDMDRVRDHPRFKATLARLKSHSNA